ncbi:unnamed protein product [Sphagnum tenellum]
MHRREAATWHHLTLQHGLLDAWTLDSFRKMSKKDYTFDNGRKGQGSAVSQIDKFLVPQERPGKAPILCRTKTRIGRDGSKQPPKGSSNAMESSRRRGNGKKGLEPKVSNKKPDWRKSDYKRTPRMKWSGISYQRRKDTWRTPSRNKWRKITSLVRQPGSRNPGRHRRDAQGQSTGRRRRPDRILPGIRRRDLPDSPLSLLGDAQERGDLGVPQQKTHNSDPQIWGPCQARKLAPNHAPRKFIQNTGQNLGQKTPSLSPKRHKARSNRLRRRKKYLRQHFLGSRSPRLGRGEQPRSRPLAVRFRKSLRSDRVGLLVRSSGKTWLLPSVDQMGQLLIRIGLVGHQAQRGGGEDLPSSQVREAGMPSLSIPFYFGDGRPRSHARRPPIQGRRASPPGRRKNYGPDLC